MKYYLLIGFIVFLSTNCVAKNYKIEINEFKNQFIDSVLKENIKCKNELNESVLVNLSGNPNTVIKFKLKEGKKVELFASSLILVGNELKAKKFNIWIPDSKYYHYDIVDFETIEIEGKYITREFKYYNVDSAMKKVCSINDSIKLLNKNKGDRYTIRVISNNKNKNDTFYLYENAIYNLEFEDNNKTLYGLIKSITQDSIEISQNLLGPLGPSQPVEFGFDVYINWLFSKGVTDDEQLQRCRDWGLVQR